jgi:hypothetical protein
MAQKRITLKYTYRYNCMPTNFQNAGFSHFWELRFIIIIIIFIQEAPLTEVFFREVL